LAAAVFGPLLLADLAYLAANSLKIVDGGWFPLAVALAIGHVVTI
jgi:KUP system potassium uptake protein